jgi:hypothetical protein
MLFDVVFFCGKQHRWGWGEWRVAGGEWRRIMFLLVPFKAVIFCIDGSFFGAEEGAAPVRQKVRLVRFRGIVIRTYVLVKDEKTQVASCRLQVWRGC